MRAGKPLADARDRHLEGLADRDRRLAYELSAGVLRRQRELDAALDLTRADPRLHDVLRLGAYQLRWLTRVPTHAAVSTAVELARETVGEGGTGYVNRTLRHLQWDAGHGTHDGSTHPDWLIQRWQQRFGAEGTDALVKWNDARPPLVIQPARWSIARLEQEFEAAGITARRAAYDAGLEVAGSRPSSFPGYADGGFIVQDPAHALVARFAGIPAGSLVYDACAAPGGKAVALEARGARVLAGEARHERIGRLVDTARRAGVAIRCFAANLEAAPLRAASLAAVLVDAPCSATGTLRRHPDARWRLHAGVFARAAARQERLLADAAALVQPGGVLIYSTCSLEPEENEAVVETFLKSHRHFRRAPMRGAVPPALLTPAGDFQSLPQRHGIDGAYAARLVRET